MSLRSRTAPRLLINGHNHFRRPTGIAVGTVFYLLGNLSARLCACCGSEPHHKHGYYCD